MKEKIFTIILIMILIFLIPGCSRDNDIQISTLKFNNNKVYGEIKNLSSNRYKIYLNLLFTNGSIKEEESCKVIVEAHEKTDFSCEIYQGDNNYNVTIASYELVELKKDKIFRDENILSDYKKINKVINQYMKNGILKHEEFSKYVFNNITIKYEELSATDHYYKVEYSSTVGFNINLFFNQEMELEEFRLYKSSESITKLEKSIILNVFDITEFDFNGSELDSYKSLLKNEDYDDYPYLYDKVGNYDYKGVSLLTNSEKGITINDYKSTYLQVSYSFIIKYN